MATPEVDRALVARFGLRAFVEAAWPHIEPTEIVVEPHIPLLCAHYEAVSRGEIRDLVVNVPPGTSKSTISSVLYPAWDWILNPGRKFMFVSYDEKLSLTFARRSMDLLRSDWFQARWPLEIDGGDRAAAGLFVNAKGGLRFSTMMGGAATGRHANILLVDDPHKPDDLTGGGESAKAALDLAWSRWTETFSRRVADAKTFARICIMQRLHEEDLSGRMLRSPRTVHLCLPMKFEPQRAYRSKWGSDWRIEPDELLCPQRFPAEVIEEMEHGPTGLSARAWASQMQQRPAPEAGALFQRDWFAQRWGTVPTGLQIVLSVDTSLKANSDSDYCVLQVWGAKAGSYWLLDQTRARMSFSRTIEEIDLLRRRWAGLRYVLVEDKANGTAIIDQLKAVMPGVLAVNPVGGKTARANAIEPLLRSGACYFPSQPWMDGFVEEAAAFPVGANDDQVDCMSQALAFLSKGRKTPLVDAMRNVRTGKMFTFGKPRP